MIILMLILLLALLSREAPALEKERILIGRADSTRSVHRDGKLTKYYVGNVEASYDGTKLSADSVIYKEEPEEIVFTGKASMVDSSRSLKADRIAYFPDEDRAVALGNVSIEEDGRKVRAKRVVYLRKDKVVKGYGDVEVVDEEGWVLTAQRVIYEEQSETLTADEDVQVAMPRRGIVVSGGRAEYNLRENKGVFLDSPRAVRGKGSLFGYKSKDYMQITGDKIEIYGGAEELAVVGNVRIKGHEVEAFSHEARYVDEVGKLTLKGEPKASHRLARNGEEGVESWIEGEGIEILLRGDSVGEITVTGNAKERSIRMGDYGDTLQSVDLSGDIIVLKLQDNKLHKAIVEGNAVSVYSPDVISKPSKIDATKIDIELEDEELKTLIAEGNATSNYYLPDDSVSQGAMNEVSGDRIKLYFEDGRIARVSVKGGILGVYRPDRDRGTGIERRQ